MSEEGGFEAGDREILCGFARQCLRDHQGEQDHRESCIKRIQGENMVMVVWDFRK